MKVGFQVPRSQKVTPTPSQMGQSSVKIIETLENEDQAFSF